MPEGAVEEFIDPTYGTSNPDDLDKLHQAEAKLSAIAADGGTVYPVTVHERFISDRLTRQARGQEPISFDDFRAAYKPPSVEDPAKLIRSHVKPTDSKPDDWAQISEPEDRKN